MVRHFALGVPSLQKCVYEIFGKFDLEFDLKFKVSDGENLVKFWGRTFLSARKARKNSGRISEQISETSFQISRLFSETSSSRRAVLILLVTTETHAQSLWLPTHAQNSPSL